MRAPPPTRILLVDDHAIVREGYRRLLDRQPDMEVVGEAADGAEAYQRLKETSPGVVVIDISMPGRGGIDTIRLLRQRDREVAVLVFTMHQNPIFALHAFQAGAQGYVTKSSAPDFLVHAVRDIARGRRVLSPDISRELALNRLSEQRNPLEDLTPREFEILRMLVQAHAPIEIAEALHISPKTVANYHYLIKSKLSVSNDVELVLLAIRSNILDVQADDVPP